jgi:hypothetical protein
MCPPPHDVRHSTCMLTFLHVENFHPCTTHARVIIADARVYTTHSRVCVIQGVYPDTATRRSVREPTADQSDCLIASHSRVSAHHAGRC